MKRTAAVLITSILLSAACSGEPAVSVAPPASTAVTSTVPTATTTPASTTTTTTLAALEIEGVPAEALALIGAPMPEVDLTLESVEDIERWFREYERWNIWLGANPTIDQVVLGYALVAGSDHFSDVTEAMMSSLNASLALVSVSSGLLEVANIKGSPDLFESGVVSVVVEARTGSEAWVVDLQGEVLSSVLSESEKGVFQTFSFVLVEGEDGRWRITQWD